MTALAHKLARCLPEPPPVAATLLHSASLEAPFGPLPGVLRMTPHGPCRVISHHFPLQEHHGDRALGDFIAQPFAHMATVTGDDRVSNLVARDALFLDIEATGLDHGTGTLAFLVGLGWFEDDSFVVEQLVLDDPANEAAMLHELVRILDSKKMLISFNGKSYDLSLLGNRLVMQRVWSRETCDLKLRPHVDLLHLARNLEGSRFANTRLATLEQELLGFFRQNDVPGHLVPACYHHHLRTGETEQMEAVLEHNLHDVLSMVTLADHLVGRSRPDPRVERHVAERDALARLFLRRRAPREALAVLSNLVQAARAPAWAQETLEALRLAAVAARRLVLPDSARLAWERVLLREPFDPGALRGLIRLESRGGHNLPRALDLARRLEAIAPSPVATRRVQRLRARMERQNGQPVKTISQHL